MRSIRLATPQAPHAMDGSSGAPGASGPPSFVADVMLGRLARWLRALGYDTLYFRDAPDARLVAVALRDGRRLLTRDTGLARRAGATGLLVRGATLDAQLQEVTGVAGPAGRAALTRCLECNTPLAAAVRDEVQGRVPAHTFATHQTFRTCPSCRRVYWPGTHVRGMLLRLAPYLDARAMTPDDGHRAR